jgi:spermidine synthase
MSYFVPDRLANRIHRSRGYRIIRVVAAAAARFLPWTARIAATAIGLFVLTHCATFSADQRTLYEQPSPYNNILVVENQPGFRTLYFERGGALQSVAKMGDPDHLELPYAKTMLSGLALCTDPQRILIVGLGGGTLPKFLHKHYPQAVIDTVDIDPDVIKVARQFFEFKEDANLRAYVSDGRKFIEDRPGSYDMIFLDAFGTDSTPYHLTTREFLLSVKSALTPRGVVLGNIWERNHNRLYDAMVRTYLATFDEVHLLKVPLAVNNILIALPRLSHVSREELVARARQISQAKGFRFDMGDAVEFGYRQAEKEVASGPVLTDAERPPGVE